MEYLKDFGFNDEDIRYLEDNVTSLFREELSKDKELVSKNISYLMDLGVHNYKDIFMEYYDMFLMDPSDFTNVFNKYDKEDLIDKLEKNMTIVEHL